VTWVNFDVGLIASASRKRGMVLISAVTDTTVQSGMAQETPSLHCSR